MNWELLIIPLIALAVWILQYVFKGPEDNKQARPRGPAGPRTAVNKPRRQVSDLDRFLEETRKRKQDEERKPVVIAQVVPEPPPVDRGEAVERERKAASRQRPEPKPRPPARPERRPARAQPSVPDQRRAAPVIPLREQLVPVLLEVAPTPAPPPLPREGPRPIRAEVGPPVSRKTTPPVLVDLLKMLKTPQGAALAVVLREVLDAPVSQRRR